MKRLIVLLALLAIIGAVALMGGCGSESSGGGNPSAFPTGPDKYEAGTGDDTYLTARTVNVGYYAVHNLYGGGDEDWVKVHLVNDVEYEFSTSRISAQTDTYIYLYDTDGTTELASDDDCYSGTYGSCLTYTPTVEGDYYVVGSFNGEANFGAYTMGIRRFIDADADGFSTYLDCDDDDDTAFPHAPETAGDGIDQDCDGIDTPATDSAIAENDDTWQTARSIRESSGFVWEFTSRSAEAKANVRTIYNAPGDPVDEDYFKLTIPAHGAYEIGDIYDGWTSVNWGNHVNVEFTLYDSDGTTELDNALTFRMVAENLTDSPKTYYIKYNATVPAETGSYLPYASSLGVDMDGDGYYTMGWAWTTDTFSFDCDDTDILINIDATDSSADGIDQNCDGTDGP